jgi:hypothetical protein
MPATEIPMFRCMIAAALVLLPAAAFADKQTAAACAGKLTPEAKLIYDTAAPTIKPDTMIRDPLPPMVRPMVMAGKVSRATAQQSGQAAGLCLNELK